MQLGFGQEQDMLQNNDLVSLVCVMCKALFQ